jgi:hypothetical protein
MKNKRFNAEETKEILNRVNVRMKSAEKYGNYTEKSFMYTLLKVVNEHYEDLKSKEENNN